MRWLLNAVVMLIQQWILRLESIKVLVIRLSKILPTCLKEGGFVSTFSHSRMDDDGFNPEPQPNV
jgi:hypothetical protein